MATIALPRPMAVHRPSSNIGPSSIGSLSSPITLDSPAPVASKQHPSVCSTGLVSQQQEARTATATGTNGSTVTTVTTTTTAAVTAAATSGGRELTQQSLLFPPDKYARLDSGSLSLYEIDAQGVAAALDYLSRQPLPEPVHVFPWFHGLHPSNHIQQAFFTSRLRALRNTPSCLRGITLVKADGDLGISRLKGAISPHEFLQPGAAAEFLQVDPREGFSVRNFQIQAAKAAMTSDIIVYSGRNDQDGSDDANVRQLAWDIVGAQQQWREQHATQGHALPRYNTFVCVSPFSDFEHRHPDIVAVDSCRRPTGAVVDFFAQERREMCAMTEASEIAPNVWLGPTPDDPATGFDVLIECSDLGRCNPDALRVVAEGARQLQLKQEQEQEQEQDHEQDHEQKMQQEPHHPHELEFPSSGSVSSLLWSDADANSIIESCRWIHHLSHGTRPCDSEFRYRPQRILIHCADGYTESTLLAIAYYSFSTGQPIPQAWLDLHRSMRRNFFAYPSDVSVLSAIAPRLLRESPVCADRTATEITAMTRHPPKWFSSLDGSLPSRIMDYMYLGNLGHANNPDLLRAMGIGQILSVGETATWRDSELQEWGADNTCVVRGVQDNGIDSLMEEFERCLAFIDRGRRNGTATLVHCRVGVSRSATICIAEVMRALGLSFPRAYCFVRARRLNVIIQPHLRFAYELLKWDELLQRRRAAERGERGTGIKRELEWGEIAREVSLMNRPYAR